MPVKVSIFYWLIRPALWYMSYLSNISRDIQEKLCNSFNISNIMEYSTASPDFWDTLYGKVIVPPFLFNMEIGAVTCGRVIDITHTFV